MEENDRPGFGILIPKIFLATKSQRKRPAARHLIVGHV